MTSDTLPPSPAAVTAFLRGLDRRARLFAAVQAGDPAQGARARGVVARVFAADAGRWPLAQWPAQYWRLLLSTPALRHPAAVDPASPLPGVSRLAPERRAAVLLQLVAGVSDDAAAGALGIEVPAYQALIRDSLPRNELGQPDVDVWRAWRAAVLRELERSEAPDPPLADPSRGEGPAQVGGALPSRGTRWLWLGVLLCVAAFAAAFFIHPAGREAVAHWFATIKREPLPPADAPKARFDARDLALHPDRERLASPAEAAFASDLAWLAWLANTPDLAGPDESLQTEDATQPLATASLPGDAAEAQARRARRWDALPVRQRGHGRAAWQAWRALEPGERVQLRALAARVVRLPDERRQALRTQFDAQPADARAGWWLGPRLGRDWPRVVALFAFVDERDRDGLLRLLRAATAEEVDALARLAQSTAPEERAALRRDLLAQPAAQRLAWLQARLQR